MAFFSLQTLRKYNPCFPVRVYFIKDNRRDSRNLKNLKYKINYVSQQKFFNFCDKQDIEIVEYQNLDLKEETGYFSAQRIVFADCLEEKVLLLDSDTFIFGDVAELFDIYKSYDFVATPNTWGRHKNIFYKGVEFKPVNSGVVLWNNWNFKKYGENVYDYCIGLKKKIHPMGEFIYAESPNGGGREELAASLFVIDNNLKYAYFKSEHVQTEEYLSKTRIFHTLTPRWHHYFSTFKKYLPKDKINLRLIPGKNYVEF